MNKTMTFEVTAEEAKELQIAMDECIEVMVRNREKMRHYQIEIDAARTATDANLAATKAMLTQLQASYHA